METAGNCPGMRHLVEETLTGSVIGAFYEVYNTLGFGFLEHIYVMALERELIARGHNVGREVGIRVRYKGDDLGPKPSFFRLISSNKQSAAPVRSAASGRPFVIDAGEDR
jgi:hypothetical protein